MALPALPWKPTGPTPRRSTATCGTGQPAASLSSAGRDLAEQAVSSITRRLVELPRRVMISRGKIRQRRQESRTVLRHHLLARRQQGGNQMHLPKLNASRDGQPDYHQIAVPAVAAWVGLRNIDL